MNEIEEITFKDAIMAPQPAHLRYVHDARSSMQAKARDGVELFELYLDRELSCVHIVSLADASRPTCSVPLTNVRQFRLVATPVPAPAPVLAVVETKPAKTATK